jgi:hypothetical protein
VAVSDGGVLAGQDNRISPLNGRENQTPDNAEPDKECAEDHMSNGQYRSTVWPNHDTELSAEGLRNDAASFVC